MKNEKYEIPEITVISIEPNESLMGQGGAGGDWGLMSGELPEDDE